ncbi:MAG: class I adenylate-forming enzyme family protein [Acidimicrobiia bacterium]
MLIGDIARRNARRFGSKPAVIFGDTELSWAALDERANRLATHLLAQGLRKGDRVGVFGPNMGEWPEITYGLAKAGLVLVPVNARVAASEAEFMLDDAGATAAIVHHSLVESFGGVVAGFDTVLQIGGSDVGRDYEQALAGGRDVDPTPADLSPDDLHFLLYTSGTTGRPKGVMNGHRSMIMQAYDTCLVTESRENDVMLATTPFYTAGGMIRTVSWMFMGQTLIIHPRFDPDHVIHDIEHRRATFTTFIPTMLQRLLKRLEEEPGHDMSSLRRISYGSAPSGPDLARRATELLGCQLQQRYGLTEAGGQVTILQPWDHDRMFTDKPWLVGSCGRETVHAEITIVDDDGNELPAGEVGEIRIVCETTATGYWNRPEETAKTFRSDGLYSGDMGRLDEEGYLYVVSRKTDMIISGGFNVYPAEIERVIGGHPNVELVAVIGVPDPEWGETTVATIVTRGDVSNEELEASLRELCRTDLAGYKQPRRFEFRTEMPLGPAGKILKRELKDEYAPGASG